MIMNLKDKLTNKLIIYSSDVICNDILNDIFMNFKLLDKIGLWHEVRNNIGHEMFVICDTNILREIKFDLEDYEFE